jgi:hypothetical protein
MAFVLGAIFAVACLPGRFAVCKSDEECQARGAGAVCYNLKCVECHYDSDCDGGRTCMAMGQCEQLAHVDETTEAADGGDAAAKPSGTSEITN